MMGKFLGMKTEVWALILLAVGGIWYLSGGEPQSVLNGQPSLSDEDMAKYQCDTSLDWTAKVKLQDDNAATETYIASNTVYMRNTETGIIEDSVATSSSAWVELNGTCGQTYELYAVAQAGAAGSAKVVEFRAEGKEDFFRMHTGQMSKMTVKVHDSDNDDWEYLFADALTEGTNSTTGVDMNSTNVFEGADGADISVSTDGYLNEEIYVKAATNRYYGTDMGKISDETGAIIGSLGHTTYVCVDDGTGNEWDIDSIQVTVDGGSALPDVKDNIDEDSVDATYLQNSEACFDIGVIDDTFTTVGLYIKADSGQDPDTSGDDITVYFLSEGLYKSSDNVDEIKAGIFDDSSSHTPVTYVLGTAALGGEVPLVVFNIQ